MVRNGNGTKWLWYENDFHNTMVQNGRYERIQILFQSAFFFSFKNVGSKPFYMSKIHPKCELHGIIVISYHNHFVPAILYHCIVKIIFVP
jgi:hypothetical protein